MVSKGGLVDLLVRASFAGGGEEEEELPSLTRLLLEPIKGDADRFMLFDSGDFELLPAIAPCNLAEDAAAGEDEPARLPELVRLSTRLPSLLCRRAGGVGGGLAFLSKRPDLRPDGEDERPLRLAVSTLRPAFGLLPLVLPALPSASLLLGEFSLSLLGTDAAATEGGSVVDATCP